jgi:hypothetical protein
VKQRTRAARKPARRRPAAGRTPNRSSKAALRATPQLSAIIRALASARRIARRPTLGAVRAALQKIGVTWSREGELLFPQDRTALVIELDELIDAYGVKAKAVDLLAGKTD